jgi:hypothetical protein
MMGALLGVVAAVAALAILVRRGRAMRGAAMQPGARPERPIAVLSFDEIDFTVEQQRCECGGRFQPRGEGPVAGAPRLRQVQIECRECDRERRLFFDVGASTRANGGIATD